MQSKKQLLLFGAVMLSLAVLECVLSPLSSYLQEAEEAITELMYYLSRILAVLPPFIMFGTALGAIKERGVAYALLFPIIYAGIDLFAQVPLSLLAYTASFSAPYPLMLFSYMLSSVLFSLLFTAVLFLGYLLFMQGKPFSYERIFSLKSGDASAVLFAASLLTVYNLISETVGIIEFARQKLFVLFVGDILDIVLSLLFVLLLGGVCFLTARLAERLLPTACLPDEQEEDIF